jgi:hypothetical protein
LWRTGSSWTTQKTNVELCVLAGTSSNCRDPGSIGSNSVTTSTRAQIEVAKSTLSSIIHSAATVAIVVVKLDPQNIELCKIDHDTHVCISALRSGAGERALWCARDKIVLGTWVDLFVGSEYGSECLDACNISQLSV